MLPTERRQRLLNQLAEVGVLAVPELSLRLEVSEATVRRDLQLLQEEGRLKRVHGGATVLSGLGDMAEPLHRDKVGAHDAEKRSIARVAAARIRDGDVIALDAGTTTLALAEELKHFEQLTVITNDLKIALNLADTPSIDVIIVGGSVRRSLYSVVGPLAERILATLNVGICFLGADAIDIDRGVTNASLSEVAVKRAMLATALQRVLLADHHKFDRLSLAEVAPITRFDDIVTDVGLSPEAVARYRAAGATLTLAPLEEHRR